MDCGGTCARCQAEKAAAKEEPLRVGQPSPAELRERIVKRPRPPAQPRPQFVRRPVVLGARGRR